MQLKHLHLGILILAITALCVAVVLPQWNCGSLFEQCAKDGVMLAVVCLLVIGIAMLSVVGIIDCVGLCSDTRSGVELAVRLALLYIGSLLTLAAVLLYTAKVVRSWSYFIATFGSIFSIQLCFLTMVQGKCGKTYTRRESSVAH